MGNRLWKFGKQDDEDNEFSDDDAAKDKQEKLFRQSVSLQRPCSDIPVKRMARSMSLDERTSKSKPSRSSMDSSKLNANLRFYQNKKETKPEPGYLIKEILKWHGDYDMLEHYAVYVLPWLFPTKTQSSVNYYSQPLQEHEANAIRNDVKLLWRAYHAYTMMLDFYGMQPVLGDHDSFTVVRAGHWQERYACLNRSRHNSLRITRILSSMGEMGFGRYQCIWLQFLLREAIEHKTLQSLDGENVHFWLDTLASEVDQVAMMEFYTSLKSKHDSSPPSSLNAFKNLETEDEMDCEDCDSDTNTDFDEPMDLNKISDSECVFLEKGCSKPDHTIRYMPNVQFYLNKLKSRPDPGFYLEELKSEAIDSDLMSKMHFHIQWLFPTPYKSAINQESFPIQEAEAMVFENSNLLKERFIEVYRLMLACYGLDVVSVETGEIQKVDGWREKFYEIDKLSPIPRIITRIVTCLGVLGFVQYQVPLVYFLLREAMWEGSLPNLDGQHVDHWIGVIVDNNERQMMADTLRTFRENQQQEVPSGWNVPKIERTEGLKEVVGNWREDHASGTDIDKPELMASATKRVERFVPGMDKLEKKVPDEEKSISWTERLKDVFVNPVVCSARKNVDHKMNANVEFYWNRKASSFFWGHKIEDMLKWKGDYHKLEMNHQYIQWLFPIPDGRGMNPSAQALQPHEAEEISQCTILQRRVLRAYEMMLDFYGMELESEESEVVRRSRNWQERYHHLNRSLHNHLRITRILKSLGCLGLRKYQTPWVNFLLHEIFVEQILPRLGGRQLLYWIEAISDESEKQEVYMKYLTLKESSR